MTLRVAIIASHQEPCAGRRPARIGPPRDARRRCLELAARRDTQKFTALEQHFYRAMRRRRCSAGGLRTASLAATTQPGPATDRRRSYQDERRNQPVPTRLRSRHLSASGSGGHVGPARSGTRPNFPCLASLPVLAADRRPAVRPSPQVHPAQRPSARSPTGMRLPARYVSATRSRKKRGRVGVGSHGVDV